MHFQLGQGHFDIKYILWVCHLFSHRIYLGQACKKYVCIYFIHKSEKVMINSCVLPFCLWWPLSHVQDNRLYILYCIVHNLKICVILCRYMRQTASIHELFMQGLTLRTVLLYFIFYIALFIIWKYVWFCVVIWNKQLVYMNCSCRAWH